MKYRVEHNQGTAGINERAIETVEVEADGPRQAIELVTNDRAGDGWHWDGDTLNNDNATNRAGSYCDYWLAEADYRNEIEKLADSLDTSANDNWRAALLEGAPKIITAAEALGIAEWLETEAPTEWRADREEIYNEIAAKIRDLIK